MDAILKNNFQNILAGYQKVADYTVSGSAITSYDFTGLNITKEDDYILTVNGLNAAGTSFYLFANNNTTNSNYYTQTIAASETSVSAERINESRFYRTSNGFAFVKIKLTNSGNFVYQSKTTRDFGSGINIVDFYGTSTFTTTSITSLRIGSQSGYTIGVGSRFQLYKRVAPIIADITVSSATTSIDITGLSIDKGSEYMLVSDNKTTVSTDIALFVNSNITQTNYYTQYIASSSTSVSGNRLNSSLFTWAGTSGNGFAIAKIKLTNNGYFVYQAEGIRQYGTSSINIFNGYATSMFTITSITSLTITSYNANGIGAGSRFQLIKLK